MNFKQVKYSAIFSILFLCNFSLNAQNDVSLSIVSNSSVTEIGDSITFNITVKNVIATNVEGLKVKVNIPSTLDFINEEIPAGTTFSAMSGEWNIFNQLDSITDSLQLKLILSPSIEGTQFVTAEVIEMIGFDFNSTVQNGSFLEDDFGTSCISVPIQIGQNDTVYLAAITQDAGVHQWYRTTNSGDELVSTDAFFSATIPGSYRYENTLSGCQSGACCDVILVEPCSITAYANAICQNNATLNDTSDDIFVIDINAVAGGTGFSGSYSVLYNGSILNAGGTTYGENVTVMHPDFISDGMSTFDIVIQDASDPDCKQELEVTAPQECSTDDCNLYAKLQENNCCEACLSGNLEIKLAYWREDFKQISAVNIARGKPSNFNSSPFGRNTNSHNSTDGLYAGEPFGGFDYSFSPFGENNYWDIDLVGFYDLETINIFTKVGCCGGNANNYRVFVSDEPFDTADFDELLNEPSIQNYSVLLTNDTTPSMLSNMNIQGRFVRIYLEGSGQMQLIEVEIIGSGNENSSSYSYTWSDLAIDNIPNPKCLPADVYTVTIMDVSTGCMVTKNIIVE